MPDRKTLQRAERDNATHLIGLGHDREGQPEVTTVTETPEEILKLAGISKKAGMPDRGVGFMRRSFDDKQ